MGSYATLWFGDFNVASFKSHLPLESLILFTQEDLHPGTRDEGGDKFETYEFRTTTSEAKRRLDARGLTMPMCRRLFDEMRSDLIYTHDAAEWEYVPNPIDFDKYIDTLRRIHDTKEGKSFPPKFLYPHGWEDDFEASLIAEDEIFHDEAETYFGDVTHCVFLRCFLEVVPPDAAISLDFSELVSAGYIDAELIPTLFDHYMRLVLRRIELDYSLYGFVIEDDPTLAARLRVKLISLSEDQFIEHVLHPLLRKMGYERLRKVSFHGPSEFGCDILPFRYRTPLGTYEYYAVQAKATEIHGTSSKQGNAGELISQATQAFSVAFVDDLDNERKRIDKFVIAANQSITPDARRVIEEAVEGKRKLVFLDIDRLVELVKQYRLLQYLLFSELK